MKRKRGRPKGSKNKPKFNEDLLKQKSLKNPCYINGEFYEKLYEKQSPTKDDFISMENRMDRLDLSLSDQVKTIENVWIIQAILLALILINILVPLFK